MAQEQHNEYVGRHQLATVCNGDMTRINVGVKPSELSRQHLIAEHREIKRIPNVVANGTAKLCNIPDDFRLGQGHVKFFYNKLGYLLRRYKKIHRECIDRGYNVQNYEGAWSGVPTELMGEYTPTANDREIVVQRINERGGLR